MVADSRLPAGVEGEASILGRAAMSSSLGPAVALMTDAESFSPGHRAASASYGHVGPIPGQWLPMAVEAPGLARDALVRDRVGGSWKDLPQNVGDWLKEHAD